MAQCGLYQITNTIDGKFYVGSSVHIERRLYQHQYKLIKGQHGNPHLQNAWNKYGAQAFSFKVLCVLKRSQLLSSEERLLRAVIGRGCYNASQHARAPMLGRKHSAKTCSQMSVSHLGRRLTPETRARMSAAKLGHKCSLKTRVRIRKALLGRKHSLETRAQMSIAAKKQWIQQRG